MFSAFLILPHYVFHKECSSISYNICITEKSSMCKQQNTVVTWDISRASLPFQNLSRRTNQRLQKVHSSSSQIFHNMPKEKSLYSSSRETRGKKTVMLSVKCVNWQYMRSLWSHTNTVICKSALPLWSATSPNSAINILSRLKSITRILSRHWTGTVFSLFT